MVGPLLEDTDLLLLLSRRLLEFYDHHQRSLPWRDNLDVYSVWLSEVMLQQTGVVTVLPYYQRFMGEFPTLQALAQAPLERVLFHWQGLGYYQRARHLHQTAQMIVLHHGGVFPQQLELLLALPGIGRNTASAILAIAFNRPYAILDGNVKRVLARLTALEAPLNRVSEQCLWQLAQRLTPVERPGDYAQAIMDLGATICTPRRPQCPRCPWQPYCRARIAGRSEHYPITLASVTKPRRWQIGLLLSRADGRILLMKRSSRGLLAGLWEPPCSDILPETTTDQPLLPALSADTVCRGFGLEAADWTTAQPIRHTFTHFHLTLFPWQGRWLSGEPDINAARHQSWDWVAPDEIGQFPIATLHRKLLQVFRRGL
ncbi:MAG: A/G-specific adenine glycosylase [Magnetococcales bacterium]|nr:A/G-specific adenine glycosylase [Magnetococcales bacterium]